MKPKITFLLIASVISLLVVFSGCKKDIDKNTLANKEASIQVANTFLTMLEVKANNHKDAKIKLLKLSLKTDNLTTFIDSNKNMFVCINSSTEVVKKSSDRYLVLKINSSGEPLWGILISYSGSTDEKNMAKVFSSFLKGSDVRDGTYTAYDYDGSFYFENEYQKNRITKIKTVGKNNLLGRSQDACIDWYLVTTYYYADGTTERTTEYVTSTCYGECPPELMCYTEAMGANSSNPPPTVTTQVDWVVGSSPSWYVKSYEALSGVKDINIPGGGYFTLATHAGDGIFNVAGSQTWQRFAVTNAAQGWVASVSIAGKVIVESIPDQELNKSHVWGFSSVWP